MNVEQFMYDYTASSEWKQIARLKWTTNEVMDFAELYAKQANPVENRVQQRAGEIYKLYPKIFNWTMQDAAIRNWYELAIRSDKTLQDCLVDLAELLLELKDKYFDELIKLHQTKEENETKMDI
jgi:hypothetical protein